jgi:hypothetical protein
MGQEFQNYLRCIFLAEVTNRAGKNCNKFEEYDFVPKYRLILEMY